MSLVTPLPENQTETVPSPAWSTYRVFGYSLLSDFPFSSGLLPTDSAPALTFTRVDRAPLEVDWKQSRPVYSSAVRSERGESVLYLHRLDGCDVLRFTRTADFYLWSRRIVCNQLDPALSFLVELRFLGPVLALWMERQRLPALHASAVDIDGSAVAFLAGNKAGKSSLAATMMQAGYSLLSDDILAVEKAGNAYLARPAYPQMRMWPREAQHFLGRVEDLERVHPALSKRRVPVGGGGFGTYCEESRPLARVYLPERSQSRGAAIGPQIIPVSSPDAVIELVRRSFAARLVESIGLAPERLGFFAGMVQRVPVRRLIYPSDLDQLPRVREAVLADLQTVRHSG